LLGALDFLVILLSQDGAPTDYGYRISISSASYDFSSGTSSHCM